MRPSFTAMPPRRGGEPRPSISITSRIARSNIAPEYTQRNRPKRGLEREGVGSGQRTQAAEVAQRDAAVADRDQPLRFEPLQLAVHLRAAGAEHHGEIRLRDAQVDLGFG